MLHCPGTVNFYILIPWGQFCQGTVSHFCTWQTIQQVFQIFIDIQVMCPCHLNHNIYSCTGLSSFRGIAEQPVFPAHCKRTDRILGKIVGKTAPTIFQICQKLPLMVLGIVHRFFKAGSFFRCLQ